MVDASLTRVFFSFSVFLICALFVGIEINRAMRRGVGKTLITLATIVSSIITGILLSRFASSILTRYIIESTSSKGPLQTRILVDRSIWNTSFQCLFRRR